MYARPGGERERGALAAAVRGDAGLPGPFPALLAARWNFELRSGPPPAPALLQEVERFVGWGLKGGWLMGGARPGYSPLNTHTCSLLHCNFVLAEAEKTYTLLAWC